MNGLQTSTWTLSPVNNSKLSCASIFLSVFRQTLDFHSLWTILPSSATVLPFSHMSWSASTVKFGRFVRERQHVRRFFLQLPSVIVLFIFMYFPEFPDHWNIINILSYHSSAFRTISGRISGIISCWNKTVVLPYQTYPN